MVTQSLFAVLLVCVFLSLSCVNSFYVNSRLFQRRSMTVKLIKNQGNDEIEKQNKKLKNTQTQNIIESDDMNTLQKLLEFYRHFSTAEKSFGFTGTAEKINGRLAMVGLIFGFTKEYFTHETLLQQIGINNTNVPEISSDVGIASLVSFFVVTSTIFSRRPPTNEDFL